MDVRGWKKEGGVESNLLWAGFGFGSGSGPGLGEFDFLPSVVLGIWGLVSADVCLEMFVCGGVGGRRGG